MMGNTAETKCSGINLKDGNKSVKLHLMIQDSFVCRKPFPKEIEDIIQTITSNGGIIGGKCQ